METILNPFNIGASLFSTNIYSYYFPQKFGILSLVFLVLLGVSLERFKGKKAINPNERKLSEASIVFICIGIGLVLLFFFYIFYNTSDLERDSIASEFRKNYVKKIESETNLELLKNKYGTGSTEVVKEKRKIEGYNNNIQELPITKDFKDSIVNTSEREIKIKYADKIYKDILSRDKIKLEGNSIKDEDNYNFEIEEKNNEIKNSFNKLYNLDKTKNSFEQLKYLDREKTKAINNNSIDKKLLEYENISSQLKNQKKAEIINSIDNEINKLDSQITSQKANKKDTSILEREKNRREYQKKLLD